MKLANEAEEKAPGTVPRLFMKDIPALLRGSPTHETLSEKTAKNGTAEVYKWNGLIWTYKLRIEHEPDGFIYLIDPK